MSKRHLLAAIAAALLAALPLHGQAQAQPRAAQAQAPVQPLRIGVAMALFDDTTSLTDLIHFQQTIFVQDRSILENQLPRLLPLDPGMEVPTQADLTSVAYRRWLKRAGYTYGAQVTAA